MGSGNACLLISPLSPRKPENPERELSKRRVRDIRLMKKSATPNVDSKGDPTSCRAPGPNERVRQAGSCSARLEDYVLLRRPRPQAGGSCEGCVGRRTPHDRRQRRWDGRWISNRHPPRETILEFILVEWNPINVRQARIPPAGSARYK